MLLCPPCPCHLSPMHCHLILRPWPLSGQGSGEASATPVLVLPSAHPVLSARTSRGPRSVNKPAQHCGILRVPTTQDGPSSAAWHSRPLPQGDHLALDTRRCSNTSESTLSPAGWAPTWSAGPVQMPPPPLPGIVWGNLPSSLPRHP